MARWKVVAVVIFTGIIVSFFVLQVTKYNSESFNDSTYSEIQTYWYDRISEIGGQKAFEELFIASEEFEPSRKHLFGHIFGGVLYELKGIDGFLVCDSRLQYGCMHEFIGLVMADMGSQAAQTLNSKCMNMEDTQQLFACQHGMGHGLLSYFGYSEEALNKALSVCETLPTIDDSQMFGCYGGVFMEYNVRTMLGEKSEIRRSEELFEPCSNLKDIYLRACAFWQPQWWRQQVLKEEGPLEAFAEMGAYCRNISSNLNVKEACFKGIGNLLPIDAKLDYSLAVQMCDVGSDAFEDRMNCRMRAGRDFNEGSHKPKLKLVCAEMDRVEYGRCLEWFQDNINKNQ